MDYKELIENLERRGMKNGSSLGEHSGLYEQAAYAITDLLARSEEAESRAEKAEKERDAAVKTIFQWTGCPECKYWDSQDEWCEKHDREADGNGGCNNPEWRGIEEDK